MPSHTPSTAVLATQSRCSHAPVVTTDQPVGQAKFGWDIHGDAGPWANAPLEIKLAGG
jgi:hypothetical protein